ncbi:MAG: CIA30 family protein [Chloroflexota bacterium]
MLLFDFTQPKTAADWSPIDDVIMGGMSYSRIRSTADGYAVFAGEVVRENNGGFASVRSPSVDLDLGGADGISLHVKGDGKRYGFILRCADVPRIRYQIAFFSEPDLWEVVHLPFSRFKPKRLGSLVWGAPPLNPRAITNCGLIISEGQYGPFELHIAWVAAYPMGD